MLTCPVCASDNVRLSRRKPKREFLKRWLGLQRYRCRDCRNVFHEPMQAGDVGAKTREHPRVNRSSERATAHQATMRQVSMRQVSGPRKRLRRVGDVVLFLTMVAVFYAALRYFGRGS